MNTTTHCSPRSQLLLSAVFSLSALLLLPLSATTVAANADASQQPSQQPELNNDQVKPMSDQQQKDEHKALIMRVQIALRNEGFYRHQPLNGQMTPVTLNAIHNYEVDKNLLITDGIDEALLESLGLKPEKR